MKNYYDIAIIGGGISAVGGMVYITTIAGCVWNHEGLSGVGWLAVALVIFCLWRPLSAIWGSVLFGALMILYLRLTIPFIPTQLYKILPYDYRVPAEKAGGSAPHLSGPELLPGRPVNRPNIPRSFGGYSSERSNYLWQAC